MSNYETIKGLALQYMQRNKMNSIYFVKEEYTKYTEGALPLMDEVLELVKTYPKDFAAYVVAFNIIGSNTRQLSDLTEKLNDRQSYYSNIALLYKIKLLANSIMFIGRNIDNEKCAEMLILELTQAFIIGINILHKTEKESEVKSLIQNSVYDITQLCATAYQIVLSFHPTLESTKHMWYLFDKISNNPDQILCSAEKLRPLQMQKLCENVICNQDHLISLLKKR